MNSEDELRGFIDSNQCVSFRWFANVLGIHVEQAKTTMGTFRESNADTFATYCITGHLKGTNETSTVAVVPEDKLDAFKNKYETVNNVHIYSLQKRAMSEIKDKLSYQLSTADALQTNELLMQAQSQEVPFLLNASGGIKMAGINMRQVGHRITMPVPVLAPSSSCASSSSSNSAAQSKGNSFFGASSSSNSSSSGSSKAGAAAKKEKPPAAVANFFATKKSAPSSSSSSSAAADADADADASVPLAAAEKQKKPEKAVTVANTFEGDDEDDEKFADRNQSKMDVSEGADANDVDTSPSADKAGKAGKKKNANLNVRGAMDDYFEDVAIEKFKAGEGDDDTPGSASKDAAGTVALGAKKKKMKLVEKMSADAKGYLVTEHVMEEVTDDEDEPPAPPARAPPAAPAAAGVKRPAPGDVKENSEPSGDKKAASKPAPAKKQKAAPAAQKSMTSFFTKK